MGVLTRLEEASLLWNAGYKEGAFILVLVAVAATARKRYPRPMSDRQSFKQFILDEMGTITGGPSSGVAFPFQGNSKTPLEDILYHHLRCEFVHEGEMPTSVYFTPPEVKNGRTFNVLKLTNPLGFPEGWVLNLARAVAGARENRQEPT